LKHTIEVKTASPPCPTHDAKLMEASLRAIEDLEIIQNFYQGS